MTAKSASFDEKERHKLEKQLTIQLFLAVEQGKLPFVKMQSVAKELVAGFDQIRQKADIVPFLEKATKKWEWYRNLLTIYRAEEQKLKEKEIIDKLSKYIKSSKVN